MKKSIKVLPIIIIFLTINFAYGQKTASIDLLAGATQENGLPKGWNFSLEGSGRAELKNDKSLYFERDFPDDKCVLSFSMKVPDGAFTLTTNFTVDGNNPLIMLNSQQMQKTNSIKSENGQLTFYITVKGDGKVWGRFNKLELAPVQNSQNLSAEAIEKIKSVAANSPVAKYEWKDRGKSTIGYIKGVALTYAKSYRELKTKQDTAVSVMSQEIGSRNADALAWYETAATSDVERLRKIYTLALGLGMRESSGNTTVGWDTSKLKENPPIQPTAENSEAGLFQTSWDSRNKSPWLLKLYDQYQTDTSQCLLSTFTEKLKDEKEPIFGSGDGAKFQQFNKECPAFATEYVMIMLRVNRRHFGPINTKKAEYNLDAEKMFKDIEKIVDGNVALSKNYQADLSKIKEKKFEESFRKNFCETNKQSQSCNTRWKNFSELLKAIKEDASVKDIQIAAFMMATIYTETDSINFSPSRAEKYGEENKDASYWNPDPVTGKKYFGRSWIQLTYKENYETAATKLGVDFVNNLDLVFQPKYAYKIMYLALTEGWLEYYRGTSPKIALADHVKLGDLIDKNSGILDYAQARAIINARCVVNCRDANGNFKNGLMKKIKHDKYLPFPEHLDAQDRMKKYPKFVEMIRESLQ